MRIALHTRVRAGRIAAYERAHAAVPAPLTVAWQARMAELLDTPHDYSAAGGDAGLPVVWQL